VTQAIALEKYKLHLNMKNASGRTIEAHLGIIKRVFKEIDLLGADAPGKLKKWRERLQREFEADKISASKIRCDVAAVRQFGSFYEAELDGKNFAAGLKSIGKHTWSPRPMARAELQKLFAQTMPTAHRAMLELYANGLRNSEVSKLRLSDVRYEPDSGSLIVHVVGKGGKVGDIPLVSSAASWLATHMLEKFVEPAVHKEWLKEFGNEPLRAAERLLVKRPSNTLLFVSKNGKPVSRRMANRWFNKYRDAAGLPSRYGPHSLRHTCATELLEAGVDIRVVQEILRHSSISTTQMYTAVRTKPKIEAVKRLDWR